MKLKKWMSIAAAVCLAVTAVPMQAAAQADFAQEMLAESREEPQEEPVEEIVEEMLAESKEEPQEELKEEPEGKEELQEQPAEEIEPQGEEVSLLTGEENGIVVQENENTDFEGTGEEDDPYLIEDADDLKTLAENVNNGTTYEGKYFKQTADIDLKNEEWTPIGTKVFKGTFDGDGYKITNLTISKRVEYIGLFGYVEGATIQNCNVTGEVEGYDYVGGIVGDTAGGTKVLNCSFRGNVTGNGYVGGIAGEMTGGGEVSSCYVIGTVHGDADGVGGIVGETYGGIKNCYALADVSAGGKFAGGIAGEASGITVESCYYSGEVPASKYAGGIAGNTRNTTVRNCVSLAKSVTGSNANRIVGNLNYGASAKNNYAWSDPVLPADDAGGLNGANLTYADGKLSPQFSDIFGSDNSAWKFTKDGLPILKDVGGEQFSELPKCMTGVGFDGFGMKTNPYLIQTAEDLKTLAQKVNGGEKYEGKYFKQTADINLNNTEWTPIGGTVIQHPSTWEISVFKGNFDGDGHQITITGDSDFGGLFGRVAEAIIQNCHVVGDVKGYNSVGGIVGGAGVNTKILNCSFQGNVKGDSDSVGGIAGDTSFGCEVSGCFVTGKKVEGLKKVGGIAGNACGTIKNCYALIDVTAKSDFSPNTNEAGNYAGGIAGDTFSVAIENCYYSGNVSAKDYAGGIAGDASGSTTIKNCVSLAESVTGGQNVNRIVGNKTDSVKLENNYGYNRTKLVIGDNTTYANGTDAKDGANVFVSAGKVMTDVRNKTLFNWAANGFSTDNGWSISERTGLPYLREDVTPDLSALPSKDLTINEEPQHFTTKNIGNGFVVKVLSGETLSENIKFTVKYRLSGTGEDTWTSDVPRTAGTYDVQITRAADGDINPFACEIPEGLVLRKKHSSSSSATAPTYTAQFDTNGGSTVSKAKTDENGKIEKPADPAKEGYIFAGWYSDSKLTKRFDFSTALTADTTLYAKWSENNEIILTIGSKTVSVFGSEIENDVAPKIVNDRTMLPIRIVAENLGGTVTWNGELQRVTIQKGEDVILITIGADTAYVNGAAVKLDAAAFVENGRTYLPLRFVSENLGAQVAWNETEKTVTITK